MSLRDILFVSIPETVIALAIGMYLLNIRGAWYNIIISIAGIIAAEVLTRGLVHNFIILGFVTVLCYLIFSFIIMRKVSIKNVIFSLICVISISFCDIATIPGVAALNRAFDNVNLFEHRFVLSTISRVLHLLILAFFVASQIKIDNRIFTTKFSELKTRDKYLLVFIIIILTCLIAFMYNNMNIFVSIYYSNTIENTLVSYMFMGLFFSVIIGAISLYCVYAVSPIVEYRKVFNQSSEDLAHGLGKVCSLEELKKIDQIINFHINEKEEGGDTDEQDKKIFNS